VGPPGVPGGPVAVGFANRPPVAPGAGSLLGVTDPGERDDLGEVGAEFREFRNQNNRVLSAMRDDLTDLRTDLTGLREHVDRGFLTVNGKLDGVAAGLHVITDLLGRGESDDRPQE
jgi:hypothetical protein